MKPTIEVLVRSEFNKWSSNYINSYQTEKNIITIFNDYIESLKYQKPEVLEVGTRVEIMESARDGAFADFPPSLKNPAEQVGSQGTIETIVDDWNGLGYYVCFNTNDKLLYYKFPHYCVRPVEEDKIVTTEDGHILATGEPIRGGLEKKDLQAFKNLRESIDNIIDVLSNK